MPNIQNSTPPASVATSTDLMGSLLNGPINLPARKPPRRTPRANTDPQRHVYPETVAECIDLNAEYPAEVLAIVKRMARRKVWRKNDTDRFKLFRRVVRRLADAYNIVRPKVKVGHLDGGCSGMSNYCLSNHTITLNGRLSVVTLLHEFGHALGYGERETVKWSVNLFRICFPLSYSRCTHDHHLLRNNRRQNQAADRQERYY